MHQKAEAMGPQMVNEEMADFHLVVFVIIRILIKQYLFFYEFSLPFSCSCLCTLLIITDELVPNEL